MKFDDPVISRKTDEVVKFLLVNYTEMILCIRARYTMTLFNTHRYRRTVP